MIPAVARPMPAPAPEINATLPSNLIAGPRCGPRSPWKLPQPLQHERADRRIERGGCLDEASDDLFFREGPVGHQDRRAVPHRRIVARIHAEVLVASVPAPDDRPFESGLIVAELEGHDGSRVGEPEDEVEALVREPATARLLVDLDCRHLLQHRTLSISSEAPRAFTADARTGGAARPSRRSRHDAGFPGRRSPSPPRRPARDSAAAWRHGRLRPECRWR